MTSWESAGFDYAVWGPVLMGPFHCRAMLPLTSTQPWSLGANRRLGCSSRGRQAGSPSDSDRCHCEAARAVTALIFLPHRGVGRLDMAPEAVCVEQGAGAPVVLQMAFMALQP